MAVAIALCYGLAMAAVVGRGCVRKPWFFAAFALGAIAFPVTVFLVNPVQLLVASAFRWDMEAYSSSVGIGFLGAGIAAAINEVFKLAATLLALSRDGTEVDAAAFGAAAGAGFGAVGAYQVIALALVARTLQIGAGSLAIPLVQQLGFVAANAASTALAAYGVTHRRLGLFLVAAILYQTLCGMLGLLFALRLVTLQTWTLLSVVIGLALLAVAAVLSRRPASSHVTS